MAKRVLVNQVSKKCPFRPAKDRRSTEHTAASNAKLHNSTEHTAANNARLHNIERQTSPNAESCTLRGWPKEQALHGLHKRKFEVATERDIQAANEHLAKVCPVYARPLLCSVTQHHHMMGASAMAPKGSPTSSMRWWRIRLWL